MRSGWAAYFQRVTHDVEHRASLLGLEGWDKLQRRRKWRLAGRMAAATDGRWARKLLHWKPWFEEEASRRVGRPIFRWTDAIEHFAGGSWSDQARDSWSVLKAGFVDAL